VGYRKKNERVEEKEQMEAGGGMERVLLERPRTVWVRVVKEIEMSIGSES